MIIRRATLHRAWPCALVACALGGSLGASPAPTVCRLAADSLMTRSAAHVWPAPLNRTISLDARDVALRDALDRLARSAGFRLSYSSELLPLDRRICAIRAPGAAGDALVELLRATNAEPVVVAADHVVLVPRRVNPAKTSPETSVPQLANVLTSVRVTGHVAGTPPRETAVGSSVVDGGRLESQGARTLAQAIAAFVPGMWVWEQSPSNFAARYGSIRGASSFGVSAPKIYVDGIEVANSLLITQLDPRAIDRVEVIRGPQGAALFGADAISGVINVVTRHDAADSSGRSVDVRSEAGRTESAFAAATVLAQSHTLSLRAGSELRSAGLSVGLRSLGEFVPGKYSRDFMGTGDVRVISSRGSLNASARLLTQEAGRGVDPALAAARFPVQVGAGRGNRVDSLLSDSVRSALLSNLNDPQFMRQYTAAATATAAATGRWTHSVTLGVDGYRLANVAYNPLLIRNATDSALRDARGGADRGTARLRSIARFGSDVLSTSLSLTAEHSVLRESNASPGSGLIAGMPPSDSGVRATSFVDWYRNSGVVVETNTALRDAVYVTAGLRIDRSTGLPTSAPFLVLPMVGAALVNDIGGTTVKVRAAYGKGIRPHRSRLDETVLMGIRSTVARADLPPEQQSGVEAGVDLTVGGALSLHVTRFDQRASGLIQAVPVVGGTSIGSASDVRALAYELQNIGQVTNRGWEIEGSLAAGGLSIAGTYSIVDSRVRQLASGYLGDLRAGDRMLEVPARTAGLTTSWTGRRWSTSLTASRAFDWINYDAIALAKAVTAGTSSLSDFTGAPLREFWMEYQGVTRLRVSATRDLYRGLALVFSGDNLLGQQGGEPDNLTILPGRTITAGVRAKF